MTKQSISDFIQELIDEEIENLREDHDEDEETPEEECLGPEEVYRMAKQHVCILIREELARLY